MWRVPFAFHDDIALMNERVLEAVSKIIDRQFPQALRPGYLQ